jgi:hypothetical protein
VEKIGSNKKYRRYPKAQNLPAASQGSKGMVPLSKKLLIINLLWNIPIVGQKY